MRGLSITEAEVIEEQRVVTQAAENAELREEDRYLRELVLQEQVSGAAKPRAKPSAKKK